MTDLDITEVAERSGVPASTLRYYEERGLVATTGRRGLRRLFDPGVLERLALIALGRAAGFSLDEIARMFAPDGRPRIDRRVPPRKPRGAGRPPGGGCSRRRLRRAPGGSARSVPYARACGPRSRARLRATWSAG